MSVYVMFGAQWGDEGKGKIGDVLARDISVMARFNGGNNAGHTIIAGGTKYALHLVPSGILRAGVDNYICRGTVVDPLVLTGEIEKLTDLGIDVSRLWIDPHSHIITSYHIALDCAQELLMGKAKIGTTKRGIGPCYADKAYRIGIRAIDLLDLQLLKDKVEIALKRHDYLLSAIGETVTSSRVIDELMSVKETFASRFIDTASMIRESIAAKKNVLLEGAQGFLLDIDHGSYPFVTSSSCHPAMATAGIGLSLSDIDGCIGVVKGYQTRVGAGPMPTELLDEVGERIREVGKEFGTTTGRPRRCGWLDLPLLKMTVENAGLTSIALTKVDVLAGFESVKVCVDYEVDGKRLNGKTPQAYTIDNAKPVYEELNGWSNDGGISANLKDYIKFIENYVGVSVSIVSFGPDRADVEFLRPVF